MSSDEESSCKTSSSGLGSSEESGIRTSSRAILDSSLLCKEGTARYSEAPATVAHTQEKCKWIYQRPSTLFRASGRASVKVQVCRMLQTSLLREEVAEGFSEGVEQGVSALEDHGCSVVVKEDFEASKASPAFRLMANPSWSGVRTPNSAPNSD